MLVVASVTAVLGAAAVPARATPPTPVPFPPFPSVPGQARLQTFVDIFGSSSRGDERYARPLAAHLRLFAGPRRPTDALPASAGSLPPLATVAAGLKGDPGSLAAGKSRRVTTDLTAYLVPTSHGWACIAALRFETCYRGLLRPGITWSFYSSERRIPGSSHASQLLQLVGLAADDVASIDLVYAGHDVRARIVRNVFSVARPLPVTSTAHLPPFGTLVIRYRDRPQLLGRVVVH
ncbi:MAG: hypothetical protein ACYDCH_14560 [Gaiellaceae bacterium]